MRMVQIWHFSIKIIKNLRFRRWTREIVLEKFETHFSTTILIIQFICIFIQFFNFHLIVAKKKIQYTCDFTCFSDCPQAYCPQILDKDPFFCTYETHIVKLPNILSSPTILRAMYFLVQNNIYIKTFPHKFMSYMNLNEGTYLIQSGFRKDTAVISCPYIPQKIQVNDTLSLKILNGAEVYWTEIRRQYCSAKKGGKEIIQAVVVGIKHCPYFCEGKNVLCTIKIQGKGENIMIRGTPLDSKLPRFDIVDHSLFDMEKQELLKEKDSIQAHYYWARFLSWDFSQERPKACLTGKFQGYKTPESQTEAILCNMDISQSKATLAKQIDSKVGQQMPLPIKNHKKFNSLLFTIDPPNSVDIEDALSLEFLDHNLYEVGVHISDVTAYKNYINREEILERGTSIYLPHKTIHMMPEKIIQMCSLQSHKERLAFSVFLTLNENGDIVSSKFQKTIVKSSARLTYQEAQAMLDNTLSDRKKFAQSKGINLKTLNEMIKKIKIMKKIAFQKRKTRSNAQIFDRNQISFKLDEKNYPINIGIKKRVDSQKLVEQFMIMANYEVAKHLVKNYGQNSLLIYHPKPSSCNIEHLNDMASDYGFRFKAESIQKLEREINELFSKGMRDEVKQLLLLRAIQIQEFATYKRYLNTFNGHYGLNLECYTHFTSPLRRFADYMVHEQIQKCLRNQKPVKSEIENLANELGKINAARTRGKKLKQKVSESFINLYLYKKQEKVATKGFIISLGLKSASIYVPIYNIIKDVFWQGRAEYTEKGSVELIYSTEDGLMRTQFQRNDAVNIEVECDIHQQVKVHLNMKI